MGNRGDRGFPGERGPVGQPGTAGLRGEIGAQGADGPPVILKLYQVYAYETGNFKILIKRLFKKNNSK